MIDKTNFYNYSEYRSGTFDTLVALKNYLDRSLIYNTDKYLTRNNIREVINCLLENLDYFIEYRDAIDLAFIFNDKKKNKIEKVFIEK